MQNTIFGIITLVFCAVFYFFSWKHLKKKQYNLSILFIVLSGFIIYTYTASDLFLHVWDERFHALVAKNLLKHPLTPTLYDNPVLAYDYQMWTENHIWLHKQPMPLWLMAGSMKLFGINEMALRLPAIIMSSISIFLTFRLGSYFYTKKTGIFAAFLFSINGLILELTAGRIATDHIDISFMFFILSAIYFITKFIEKQTIIYTLLIGICIGGAVLTKWLVGLIVLPIWILLIWESKSFQIKTIIAHLTIMIFTIVLIVLPWQIYIFNTFPLEAAYEAQFNLRHFTEEIEGRTGSIFYFVNRIRVNYGELIYLPLIWLMWMLYKNPKNYKKMALFVWFVIPLVVFSIAKTKMQGYLLFTAPVFFIITSAFFFELAAYRTLHKPKWFYNLLLVSFFFLPIRYGLERMKPFEIRNRNPKWTRDLRDLNNKHIQKGILFNYDHPIEAMFYTDLIVYPILPSKENIEHLKNEGYQILINDKGDISDFIDNKNIQILKLTSAHI